MLVRDRRGYTPTTVGGTASVIAAGALWNGWV
jgi:hypothetical protein